MQYLNTMAVILCVVLWPALLFGQTKQQEKSHYSNFVISKQNLVGIWQADDSLESSNWPRTYRFFKDGTYIFSTSQYDLIGRIISFTGKYRIEGRVLYTTVESRKELVGGRIERGGIEGDEWMLEGAEVQDIPQGTEEMWTDIETCNNWTPRQRFCLLINSRRYYKMDDNPDKY